MGLLFYEKSAQLQVTYFMNIYITLLLTLVT